MNFDDAGGSSGFRSFAEAELYADNYCAKHNLITPEQDEAISRFSERVIAARRRFSPGNDSAWLAFCGEKEEAYAELMAALPKVKSVAAFWRVVQGSPDSELTARITAETYPRKKASNSGFGGFLLRVDKPADSAEKDQKQVTLATKGKKRTAEKLEYRWWCRQQRLNGVVGPLPTEDEAMAKGKCRRDNVCLAEFGVYIIKCKVSYSLPASAGKIRPKRPCPDCNKKELSFRGRYCENCGKARRRATKALSKDKEAKRAATKALSKDQKGTLNGHSSLEEKEGSATTIPNGQNQSLNCPPTASRQESQNGGGHHGAT